MKKPFLTTAALAGTILLLLSFRGQQERYKNLRILPQNITEKQMDSVMNHFSAALNVDCGFCHVKNGTGTDWDYPSDDNKHKRIAREMMTMTNAINDQYFNYTGAARTIETQLMVTCATCHNGNKMPETNPPQKKD